MLFFLTFLEVQKINSYLEVITCKYTARNEWR
jgi:hypothetical protein